MNVVGDTYRSALSTIVYYLMYPTVEYDDDADTLIALLLLLSYVQL